MIKLRKSSVAAISRLCSYSVVILFLILFSSSVKASCEYELISPGDFNSTARITLINTGSTAVSAWDITWTYVDTGIDVFNVNYDNANSTNSVNNTSFILDESSNPTITATAPNFNASNIVDFTLDPGDVAVLEVRTNGIVNGGSGLIVPGSLTGALCGQSVVSQSLTIVKEVINDNSGTSVVTDFGIATNAGSPISFVASSTSNNITTYTSDPITVSPGTYSLSENDLTDYNEGSWVCTGAAGAVVDTFNAGSVVIADGETVICTIVNDDVSPIIPLPTEVPATSCLDNSQLRAFLRAADWNSNDTNPAAGIVNQPAVFLTASDFVAGPGINISFPFSRTEISGADQANFSSAYMAGDYIEYTVETIAGLGNTSAISGIAENGGSNNIPYQMDLLISDDNFTTATRIFSNYTVSSGFNFISDIENVLLSAGTEYKFRLVFYGANPSTSNILMDDFAISVDDCPVVEPELTVTKTTSTTPDFAGNTANYTIMVTNTVGEAVDVVITDTPENTGFTYASSSVMLSGGATRTSTADPTLNDTVMNWSNFTLPAGGSVEIDLTVNVATTVPSGVYDNSVSLTTSSGGATINNYDGTVTANTGEDVVIYQLSPLAGSLVINEVLYRATGAGAAGNDEFIELYNAGTSAINLNGLMLIDGNKVTGDLDGTIGSITGNTMSFDFSCTGSHVCTGATTLSPGEYAVIWVGTQDLTNRNATGASFQAWLGQTQKLANGADDVWLFGENNEFIDYVAWGASTSASVDTDYPAGVWDDSVQATLDGVPAGVSISLTPNGVDVDESDCWEETLSADSSSRCSGYLPTIDTDTVGTRITSVGGNNNGGTIIIEKQTLPDGSAQSFNFTGDITASLTDGNSSTPVSLPAGTYTVTESALAGWALNSITCDDADSTGDVSTATASFNLVAGETITCVFTNEQLANLTLVKTVENSVGGGTALAADWTLEANIGGGTAEISGTSGISMDVAAGDYILSELNGPNGYILDSLTCDIGVLNTATLTLEPGDESTCTFINRDLITDLSITKSVNDTNPSPGDILTFTLRVMNDGPDDATNIVINDSLLDGFTFVAGSMTGGDTQNQVAPGLVWNINSLAAGVTNEVTLTYQAIVDTP